jgi:hypothetical protein
MADANTNNEQSGTYETSVENFLGTLKKSFKKKHDLFTQSRAREATGSHPSQIKKWIPTLVQQRKLREVSAYFLGCSLTEPIVFPSDVGPVAVCPTCNSELLWPPVTREVVCETCKVRYVDDGNGHWKYQPQVELIEDGVWCVESFSHPTKYYTVDTFEKSCTCPDYSFRSTYCKHLKQVDETIASIQSAYMDAIAVGRAHGVSAEQGLMMAMEIANGIKQPRNLLEQSSLYMRFQGLVRAMKTREK